MKQLLFVFIGGGFGSVLRYIIAKYLNNQDHMHRLKENDNYQNQPV